ncbi:MAG: aminomethyl-transferring glycine dehydrogenase [Acidimicrobiia bacterium]
MTKQERFWQRHVGPGTADTDHMLTAIGLDSLEQLISEAVPEAIQSREELSLPSPLTETEVLAELRGLADQNEVYTSMIGMGYYGTIMPAVLQRNVLENPAWYTSYTPYQPEISQGRLEALLNFQTMVSDLTAMEIANSSLLDEGTAAAEAMTMCRRISDHTSDAFFVDADCHPQTIAVLRTRAEPLGLELVVGDPIEDLEPGEVFGAIFQYPGSSGEIRDFRSAVERIHVGGGLAVFAADLLALVLLAPPGVLGADVVVGSSQRFGVPMGFGGPHAAYFATLEKHARSMPGRLVGVSVDSEGRTALRLALQTREQHIRRERATSNICTAQVLLANLAGLYATYHGPEGLKAIAGRVHRMTAALADGLRSADVEIANRFFFDTLTVRLPGQAAKYLEKARARRINLRAIDDATLGISLDETTRPEHIDALFEVFGVEATEVDVAADMSGIPEGLRRESEILTHPIFSRYRTETEMLRYLRHLADRDLALDRSMIPLGSCTMKLNATTEMIPITWPEFSDLHPFAPLDQASGYMALIAELEQMLAEITGFSAVSLQPNAGSQGEYAGLLAIRRYHESRGEPHRDICLIPASAHGTNPASAIMAGLEVVVVACDDEGNVGVDDLRLRLKENGEQVAAFMITYPSTHGVFEESITEICDLVHEHGGQVYFDGANLNAMVGIARPGDFGADVAHLNLHKTFCIPHGGGGPGVGPIGVAAHLEPFLPNHPLAPEAGPDTGIGPVASAPWGSAGILPISWAYIRLMGPDGLTAATQYAILAANYVAARLAPHYPILYVGARGRVAHECIADLRGFKASAGVTAEDVAKRLIDYGFHAPTLSFPVAGTLMIEPTESESMAELERFCEAMISIRQEIAEISEGEVAYEDSLLAHAPHTAEDLIAGDWDRLYSRERAAFPVPSLRTAKYWPPVSRIDAGHGDRNLMCACPPIEAYLE